VENLNALRVFFRVAETKSFTVAANRLGLTSSAVSKAITRLEIELGVKLLHRTTRSVSLTNEGTRFFEQCQQILLDIENAEHTLSRATSTPNGRLRIHLPVGFGRQVIVPALSKFIDLYPDLIVDAELSDRSVDLAYEGIDATVLIGEPADNRLIARHLCHLQFVACASPEYLEKRGEPQTPDDLDQHHCLSYVMMNSGRYREWHFQKGTHTFSKTVSGRLNINNAESLLEAACSGVGIVMISNFIAGHAIRTGKLRTILNDYRAIGPPVSVVYLPNRHLSAKVRVFIDFLKQHITDNPDWDR
jgi:LysR family transcriptional regulator for bpeEF and oprC